MDPFPEQVDHELGDGDEGAVHQVLMEIDVGMELGDQLVASPFSREVDEKEVVEDLKCVLVGGTKRDVRWKMRFPKMGGKTG